MKIMVAGDSHGNIGYIRACLKKCEENGIDTLIQLGDFGYWEHTVYGLTFMVQCQNAAAAFGVHLYWIDGNHENHPLLWGKYKEVNDEGFIMMRPNVSYIPRGHSWEWDGVKMMGVGGAYSIDKAARLYEMSMDREEQWWATEDLRDSEVEKALETENLDIIFTHDIPESVSIVKEGFSWLPECAVTRDRLDTIVKATRPKLLCHGHFHRRWKKEMTFPFDNNGEMDWWRVQIEGYSNEFPLDDSTGIIDLEMWKDGTN